MVVLPCMCKRFCTCLLFVGVLTFLPATFVWAQNFAFSKTLRRGSSGSEVTTLQAFLKTMPDVYPEGLTTGYFGALTEKAVQRFQTKHGIVSSGIPDASGYGLVGPRTRSVLNNNFLGGSPQPEKPVGTARPSVSPQLTPTAVPEKPYFTYNWRADDTLTGEVSLPTPVARPIVVLHSQKIVIPQTSPALRLAEVHNIALVDNEEKWDEETAGKLLVIMQRLKDILYKFGYKKSWRVILTSQPLSNDVEIVAEASDDQAGTVRFYKAAFQFSNPDENFYSNRLYRAILKGFFNDRVLLERILKERYGVAAGFADPRDEFQDFTLDELQYVATVFEDLPIGFHHIPGLEKVVRRKNGLTNPLHPLAPAIAWVSSGYIEFMDFAFQSGNEDYIRRLIAHEMTHFVWHKILSEETKSQFMKFSGWSKTRPAGGISASSGTASDHPKASSIADKIELWYRTTTANFVSDYAALLNPDEDFAETVSYYIYQPDKVRTFTPEKYNFVKNVVNGYEYVILVDEKYTFQVFNLEPDTTFPGKIIGTDIEVYKVNGGANKAIITLYLSPKYGDGAQEAYSRISSSANTSFDVYFFPVAGDQFTLRTELIIPKTAASGYWLPGQITVRDRVDNRRQEGQAQFGWLLYVNNPSEDLKPPVPDIDHITHTREEKNGDQVIRIFVPVTDEYEEGLYGYGTLQHYDSNEYLEDYAEYNFQKKSLMYEFTIRKYHASGQWTFRELNTFDLAENSGRYDLKEKAVIFPVTTSNPDSKKPELDLSAIRIKAVPRRPKAPNGETDVTIWYAARDDNSGLGWVNYQILKPTGDTIFDYHYHENFHTDYFIGDPTTMQTYEIKLTLPPGSPPGTWILQQLVLKDKAGNTLTSNFIEIGIVRPFDVR